MDDIILHLLEFATIILHHETHYISSLHKQWQTSCSNNIIVCIDIQCWKVQYSYEHFWCFMVLSNGMYLIYISNAKLKHV
jgi:predicted protein tyrosine phosphatase